MECCRYQSRNALGHPVCLYFLGMGDGSDMLRLLSDLWVIIFMVQSYVIVMAISGMLYHGCYIRDAISWMLYHGGYVMDGRPSYIMEASSW